MTVALDIEALPDDYIVCVSQSSVSSRTAHLPADDDSAMPACGRVQEDTGREWRRREVQHLIGWLENWSVCHYCKPSESRESVDAEYSSSELHAEVSQ